jgi:hypothetical protein
MDVISIPAYFLLICEAHVVEIKVRAGDEKEYMSYCLGKDKVRLDILGMILERTIFHSYLLTIVIFLLIGTFRKINDRFKSFKQEEILHADYLDVFTNAQHVFSLKCFEFIVTLEMFIEHELLSKRYSNLDLHPEDSTYSNAMTILIVYGILSFLSAF